MKNIQKKSNENYKNIGENLAKKINGIEETLKNKIKDKLQAFYIEVKVFTKIFISKVIYHKTIII